MVGFLEGMRGKVEGVVRSAEEMKGNGEEVDVRRVQEVSGVAPTGHNVNDVEC